MTFKVGIITPNDNDACSWYRTMGPWNALTKQYQGIEIVPMPKIDWVLAGRVDVIFMQRPYSAEHVSAATIATKSKVPIWLDWDDDLWEVPRWNPAWKHFMTEACHLALKTVCELARVITVTTEDMAAAIGARTGKTPFVVPNALDDRMPLVQPDPAKNVYWWRGGIQHRMDHVVTAEMFTAVAEADPTAKFLVIGDDPFWTDRPCFKGRMEVIREAIDIVLFHELLCEKNPSVLLYGLDDCAFNHAKSSCSWLEATMCGSIAVGPAFREWERPGILRYEPGNMESARNAALLSLKVNREEHWKASANELQSQYRLSVVNRRRYDILRSLAAGMGIRI
jgi:hypothetical protein